jgi:hypothetical protein
VSYKYQLQISHYLALIDCILTLHVRVAPVRARRLAGRGRSLREVQV